MSQSSIQIETGNVVRINNGTGFNTFNFYRLKYIKSHIVQGVTTSIPNTSPTLAQVLAANNGLDANVSTYCTSNFAYGADWLTTPRYICYESNRDIMNAAGASVSYLHAQVDVYQIVQIAENNKM
jgi:hypothetical protein